MKKRIRNAMKYSLAAMLFCIYCGCQPTGHRSVKVMEGYRTAMHSAGMGKQSVLLTPNEDALLRHILAPSSLSKTQSRVIRNTQANCEMFYFLSIGDDIFDGSICFNSKGRLIDRIAISGKNRSELELSLIHISEPTRPY